MKKLILLPTIFLSLLGITMMASISPERILFQATFVVLATLGGWLVYRIGIKNLISLVWPLYITAVIFMILTLVFGTAIRGSVRWLEFGGVKLQSSEIAKPILLLTTVYFFSREWLNKKRGQLVMFIKAGLAAGVLIGLVALQPDLGTAMVLTAIFVSAFVISSAPKWLMGAGILLLILLVLLGKFGKLGLRDYQTRRLESFVNPYLDPKGDGYQVIQSTIAVGSGMLTGRGLGRGTQSQLQFLPEKHTDFIFASIVEELGFLGGTLILGLYSVLTWGLVEAAWVAKSRVERLLLGSSAGWLFFQSAINIMMNLGLAPVTGITLPFLSSGGSSLMSSAVIMGLALSAIERREKA